jgi:hypothetical protein
LIPGSSSSERTEGEESIQEEDRLLLRGRKPMFKRVDKSLSLNFEGRVKKASRKNIQLVIILGRRLHSSPIGIQISER